MRLERADDGAPIVFQATPTMSQFMQSDAYVRLLAGPVGGGKSVACCHELVRMAQMQTPNRRGERLTRFLIVRNTADQLRSTTLKTIKDWFPPAEGFGRWAATERTLYYQFGLSDKTIVKSEWMLRALDDEADIANALSLEVTAMWANECREMLAPVFAALLKRTNRYPSPKSGGGFATRAGAICDTNMPGMETYWETQMSAPPSNWSVHVQPPAVLPLADWIDRYGEDPPEELRATTTAGVTFVVDPNADNVSNLAPSYYTDAVKTDKQDDIDVYLRCRFGRTLSGLPVYDQTFHFDKHVAKEPLQVIRSENYPLCIGLDLGRTPAAVFGQMTPRGRVQILSELTSENMGIQTFLMTKLKPHLAEKYPGVPCYVAPDPAGWQKSQVNEKCPVDYLKLAGFRIVRPPTNKTKLRIEAVDTLLARSVDGEAGFVIDPSCRTLIKGFRGGYKWSVNKRGDLTNESEPTKNQFSHIHDACQYLSIVIDGDHSGAARRAARVIQVANARGWR
jgi:hypothetical protein